MTYPVVPLPNQWAAGFVNETDMHNRIDTPLNAMGNVISLWGQDFAHFRARAAVSPAALDTNIDFTTIVEDTSNAWSGGGPGWDSVNKRYVIQKNGLYVIQAGWSQASAVAGILEITALRGPQNPIVFSGAMGTAATYGQDLDITDNMQAGDTLALRMRGALATAGNIASRAVCYMTIVMIGY
jgi:hypothetical protein